LALGGDASVTRIFIVNKIIINENNYYFWRRILLNFTFYFKNVSVYIFLKRLSFIIITFFKKISLSSLNKILRGKSSSFRSINFIKIFIKIFH